ncbi:MAG: C4-type zinc ribbon domain-containing protein [Clostridia bacterium]|nr:C4-type zinc ribbon domain-containing protein [Clostridia bacterium]
MSRIDALLAYQKADEEKQQLELAVKTTENRQRLNKLHKLLKEQQATVAKANENLELTTAALARIQAQCSAFFDRYELESAELDNLKQDEECTGEEMTEFRLDIEKLSREIGAMEKEAERLLESLNKLVDDYQKTRQVAGKAKKEYDKLRLVCEEEKERSAAAIDDCAKEMKRLAERVDDRLMQRYRRARQHYPTPVVPVLHQKCSGCNMSLPTLMLKKLLNADSVAECENCGRLLYITKE